MAEKLKVVIIGAASPQWGHKISRDFIVALSQEKLSSRFEPVLVMEDIDAVNLEKQHRLAAKVAEAAGGKVAVQSTTDQKEAIDGARFVVTTFAQGTLEAMQYDLEIPQEYGIYQPVGDTISIGGAIRAARNIPALLNMARDMEASAHPDAWMLNLCNPMSILCRAVTRETRVTTVGCCHELYGGVGFLAGRLGFPYDEWRSRLSMNVLGVNHCGWMREVKHDGNDAFEILREKLASCGITSEVKRLYDSDHPELRRQNVKINLFLRHGILPYSGDRHTSEFFAEFVNRSTNKGADFGVMLTTPQDRIVNWRGGAREQINKLLAGEKELDLTVSREAASRIMTAVLLDEPFYDVGNVAYHGTDLPGIPDGAVLERMVTYSAGGAQPDACSPLPAVLMDHLRDLTDEIEKIVEASVKGDRKLLIEALEQDLLMKNMDAAKIPELVGRLLEVHREYVHPGFF